MKKIRALFRLAVAASILFAVFVLFFLQEVNFLGDGLVRACEDNGIALPLKNPRIEVTVQGKTLAVYEGDRLVRRYDCATGASRRTDVLSRDVDSTPLGEYEIIAKEKRKGVFSRGARFLRINFPSIEDVDRAYEMELLSTEEYNRCISAHKRGEPMPGDLPIGGDLGIQGNYFLFTGPDFTDGSIALSNSDINELFEHVGVGTPVVIKK